MRKGVVSGPEKNVKPIADAQYIRYEQE